jgi:hypothetical protein
MARSVLLTQCREAAQRTVEWIASRMEEDGTIGEGCGDLACYYKPPYLMQLAGRPWEARRLLDCISARFQRPDGDFRNSDSIKTADPVLALYPGYTNAWIAMAAHKIGRFDVSFPAWGYLRRFWHEDSGGFALEPATGGSAAVIEVLMCAHLGLTALYLGDLERAQGAGNALATFLDQQPSPETRFFLRMNARGELQTEYDEDAAGLHVIETHQPGQAWFFIGYPMAFLARLYQASGDTGYLAAARGYFAFSTRCADNMVGEHFAHKVAWGAAELARASGDATPRELSDAIVRQLLAKQGDDGTWMRHQPLHTRVDQSAEVAIWLLEIAALG